MQIRQAKEQDLMPLLALYTHLHHNPLPVRDARLEAVWRAILADVNQSVLVGEEAGELICSCVLVVVRNLTHEQRPYALIENVVTHEEHRGQGYASALLRAACDLARQENCYKIMLMTGSKEQSTLRFYERAGFNRQDKTAFVRWLGRV